MDKLNFTQQQAQVIDDRGGSLLVSAAAGTGKTRVLVERIMKKLAEEQEDISDFIIITYTTAAAAELKGRIMEEIISRSAADPDNRHLRRQVSMVNAAGIGTIHRFCGNVIREYAHDLDISPDFRNIDETEIDMIKQEVLLELIDGRYRDMRAYEGFQELVDTLSSGRSDDGLVSTVLQAYNSLQSHPYPRQWISLELAGIEEMNGMKVADTHWGKYLIDETLKVAEYWIEEFHGSVETIKSDEKLSKYYLTQWRETIVNLIQFRDALTEGWDKVHALGDLQFPRINRTPEGYEFLKEKRKRCMTEMRKILKMFSVGEDAVKADIRKSGLIAGAFLMLILDFDDAYTTEKRRRNVLDFNDLEHLALNVLAEKDSGAPTDAARDIAQRYKEVMVDEFQDVNTVQNMIFSSITDKNLFVVGDVKQSIYRFRLANPSIFMDYYATYADAAEAAEGEPRKVLLSKNFRSDGKILDAVNFVFQQVMKGDFCGLDYREREFLIAGRSPAEPDACPVELNVIDQADFEAYEAAERADIEPRFVAQRIRSLIESEGYTADDIVILVRSRSKAWRYEREMKKLGVPVAGGQEDFYHSREIMSLTAVLDIIDNPTRDVSLIAAMTCPLFGFSEDELADIRCNMPSGSFYSAVKAAAERDELCRKFLETLSDLRTMVSGMTTQNLLWQVLEVTGALSIYGAMENGQIRRGNIMAMLEYAGSYEARGYRGLFKFLEMFKSEGEKGKLTGPEVAFMGGAVRIMTIHGSKGLEFPVVILAEMSKRFNSDDVKGNVLIHPELGVGITLKQMERKIRYSTMPRDAVARKITDENKQEEMRVLYVAMTRAEKKLIMTAAFTNAARTIDNLSSTANLPLSPHVIGGVSSMAEWVLLPLLLTQEKAALGIAGPSPLGRCGWAVNALRWDDFLEDKRLLAAPSSQDTQQGGSLEEEGIDAIAAQISERIYYEYKYADSTDLASKLTATEIKTKLSQAAAEDAESLSKRRYVVDRPSFVKEKGDFTGAERGTAAHLVMQYADYGKCGSVSGIAEEISRLEALRLITSDQARAAEPEMLFRFFGSPLGIEVMSAENLRREFKFSLLAPAGKYYPEAVEEEILLQGVVDCFFETDEGLVVVDFKTDRVSKENLSERAQSYAPQLEVYSYALKRITGQTVVRRVLFFFALGETVEI